MDFFPDPPEPADDDAPDEHPAPIWVSAPEDVMPGVVPVELILGRSASTVVMLTGIRAFPNGLAMTLGVRVRGRVGRRDLNSEVFDGPYNHDTDPPWQANRLKWGFELADGRRVTNVDPSPWAELTQHEPSTPASPGGWLREPEHPVLTGGGGGGGTRSVDRSFWLWPLPPAGTLRVVCQWPAQGIETTVHELVAEPFLEAARHAVSIWGPATSPEQ